MSAQLYSGLWRGDYTLSQHNTHPILTLPNDVYSGILVAVSPWSNMPILALMMLEDSHPSR